MECGICSRELRSVEVRLVKEILETTQTAFVRVQKTPWDSDLVSGRSKDRWNEQALGASSKIPKPEIQASTSC